MRKFEFSIRYETRNVVINGTATVVGDYDGPSKPEAMIRHALKGTEGDGDLHGLLRLVWTNEP